MADEMPPATPEEPKHRVRLEDTRLVIGEFDFPVVNLAQWKAWSAIEAACKRLDPEISALELDVIERAAAHLGSGARNGLAELKSALATTRRAKVS